MQPAPTTTGLRLTYPRLITSNPIFLALNLFNRQVFEGDYPQIIKDMALGRPDLEIIARDLYIRETQEWHIEAWGRDIEFHNGRKILQSISYGIVPPLLNMRPIFHLLRPFQLLDIYLHLALQESSTTSMVVPYPTPNVSHLLPRYSTGAKFNRLMTVMLTNLCQEFTGLPSALETTFNNFNLNNDSAELKQMPEATREFVRILFLVRQSRHSRTLADYHTVKSNLLALSALIRTFLKGFYLPIDLPNLTQNRHISSSLSAKLIKMQNEYNNHATYCTTTALTLSPLFLMQCSFRTFLPSNAILDVGVMMAPSKACEVANLEAQIWSCAFKLAQDQDPDITITALLKACHTDGTNKARAILHTRFQEIFSLTTAQPHPSHVNVKSTDTSAVKKETVEAHVHVSDWKKHLSWRPEEEEEEDADSEMQLYEDMVEPDSPDVSFWNKLLQPDEDADMQPPENDSDEEDELDESSSGKRSDHSNVGEGANEVTPDLQEDVKEEDGTPISLSDGENDMENLPESQQLDQRKGKRQRNLFTRRTIRQRQLPSLSRLRKKKSSSSRLRKEKPSSSRLRKHSSLVKQSRFQNISLVDDFTVDKEAFMPFLFQNIFPRVEENTPNVKLRTVTYTLPGSTTSYTYRLTSEQDEQHWLRILDQAKHSTSQSISTINFATFQAMQPHERQDVFARSHLLISEVSDNVTMVTPGLQSICIQSTALWERTRKEFGDVYDEPTPMNQFRSISYSSTENAFSVSNMDTNGYATVIVPVNSAQLWAVATPKNGQDISRAVMFQGFKDPYNYRIEDYNWDIVLLDKTTIFYMLPGTLHAVYTTEPGYTIGEHFYACRNLNQSLYSIFQLSVYSHILTNALHDGYDIKSFARIVSLWYLSVSNSERFGQDQGSAHPVGLDLGAPMDMLTLALTGAFLVLAHAVDSRAYAPEGIGEVEEAQLTIACRQYISLVNHIQAKYYFRVANGPWIEPKEGFFHTGLLHVGAILCIMHHHRESIDSAEQEQDWELDAYMRQPPISYLRLRERIAKLLDASGVHSARERLLAKISEQGVCKHEAKFDGWIHINRMSIHRRE